MYRRDFVYTKRIMSQSESLLIRALACDVCECRLRVYAKDLRKLEPLVYDSWKQREAVEQADRIHSMIKGDLPGLFDTVKSWAGLQYGARGCEKL